MSGKTPISNAQTYREIGAFWDEHDSTEEGEQKEVEFNVNIESQRRYYLIDQQLSKKIKQVAEKRGISEDTLLNLWVQEKILQAETETPA